jgi:hypothetical protein
MKTIVWSGKEISKPCVIKDMPLDAYHSQCCAGPSVSSTSLRRVLEENGGSPAHFFCEWSGNPNRVEPDDEKAHLVLGRAVHHYLLGQSAFNKEFAIRPTEFDSWRTAAAKEWRSEVEASGRSVLTEEHVVDMMGMARSLADNTEVKLGLLSGQIERSMFWCDKETGLWCKVRPDAVPTDGGDFADLKTTTAVQYDDLCSSVRRFGYHQQAALIFEGAKIVADIGMSSFTFVFVEKKPPYCVRLVNLKEPDLILGHKQNRAARLLIARCIKEGRWPGPGDGHIVNIDLGERYRGIASSNIERIGVEP